MSTGARRSGFLSLLFLSWSALSALLPIPASRAAGPGAIPNPFRLVSADASGVTLEYDAPAVTIRSIETGAGTFQELTIPGHLRSGLKGRPALPGRSAGLAIPEGANPRLSWEILETADYPAVRPLPALDGWPADDAELDDEAGTPIDRVAYRGVAPAAPAVRISEIGYLRHHRVGQVSVTPLTWDPGSGNLTQIRRARIRVDFQAGAPAPRGRLAAPVTIPAGEEPAWEETYRETLINYESARSFRTRPAPEPIRPELGAMGRDPSGQGPAGRAPSEFNPTAAGSGNPEYRLFVGRSGAYHATYNELATQGWPAGIAVADLCLYEKAYNAADPSQPLTRNVPTHVVEVEGGTPGIFDGDDSLYFYALNYADRFQPGQAEGRYSAIHACWLSWRAGGRVPMATFPGWFESSSVTTPTSFIQRTHWEENKKYINLAPPGTAGALALPQIDTHYWLDAAVSRDSLDFQTPGRDPAGKVRVQARWQGYFSGNHFVSIWLTRAGCPGSAPPADTLLIFKVGFGSAAAYVYDSGFTIPGIRLYDGCNRFKVQGNGFANGDPNSAGSGAYFDWFNVDYSRRYVASAGHLRFTSAGATGDVEFAIRGLRTNAAFVFDVTDSLTPRWVEITPDQFTEITTRPPREYELRFRVNIDRQRTYVLYEPDALPAWGEAVAIGAMPPDQGSSNFALDRAADLTTDTGADVIVLGHASLLPYFEEWKARREAQGHRLQMVDIQDVFDQFNGSATRFNGGDKSVPAIRTWLRYLYRHWARPPDYLVMIGDASEDYRNDLGESDPDWVPTMMFYGPVPGTDSRYELVGTDHWFVAALGPNDTETDPLPEMYVGRIPVGSATEAQAFADKMAAYEQYSPDDTWRNRGLIVSDDQYSQPISGAQNYCFQAIERIFEEAGDSLQIVIGSQSCYNGFQVDHFKLREFLAPLNRPPACLPKETFDQAATLARQTATPAWVQQSSQGHLFQIYSGHANRFVMASERFVEFNGSFVSPDARITEQLTNYGKPFLYFGVGCHLNQFQSYQERETKHCLAESMLLLPGRGAIGTVGSTGFEWLPTNEGVELYLGDVCFSQHARDPVTQRPRRIMGEATYVALLRLLVESAAINSPYADYYRDTIRTYCLLGDPTLRFDMAVPNLAVSVEGEPVEPGTALRAAPGSNSVSLGVRLADDVDQTPDGFGIALGDSTVPATEYTLTPFQTSLRGACHGYLGEYTARLEPDNYTVTIRATDWIGRTMEFPLQVRLLTEFRIDGHPLTSGERIPVDAPVEAVVTSPVALQPGDVEFLVNGEPGAFQVAAGTDDREWIGTVRTGLPAGAITLAARVRGKSTIPLAVDVQGDASFGEVYFYPSPWEGDGPGHFTYQLSYRAEDRPDRAEISVYTVSGRKVITLDGTTDIGRNRVAWDMRDQKGDGIANGVYLYKVTVRGPAGKPFTTIDRLVVHR